MSGVTYETVRYGAWKHCARLSDGRVELMVTLDVGPRIIRLGTVGGANLFKEFPEHAGQTRGPEWLSFGGHRLWHAPEVAGRTYAPDFDRVDAAWDGQVLTLRPPQEPSTGLRKEIRLGFDGDSIVVDHRLINENLWSIKASPWCLSVMAPGGRAIVPQEPFIPHPDRFAPARPLVLWHFTAMDDPRYTWGSRFIQLRQDERYSTKQKIGLANKQGWAAYHLGRELFVKTFAWDETATYPDYGCNCELFTMPGFLEVESLGPLAAIEPGQGVDHREVWKVFTNVDLPDGDEALARALGPYVEVTP